MRATTIIASAALALVLIGCGGMVIEDDPEVGQLQQAAYVDPPNVVLDPIGEGGGGGGGCGPTVPLPWWDCAQCVLSGAQSYTSCPKCLYKVYQAAKRLEAAGGLKQMTCWEYDKCNKMGYDVEDLDQLIACPVYKYRVACCEGEKDYCNAFKSGHDYYSYQSSSGYIKYQQCKAKFGQVGMCQIDCVYGFNLSCAGGESDLTGFFSPSASFPPSMPTGCTYNGCHYWGIAPTCGGVPVTEPTTYTPPPPAPPAPTTTTTTTTPSDSDDGTTDGSASSTSSATSTISPTPTKPYTRPAFPAFDCPGCAL